MVNLFVTFSLQLELQCISLDVFVCQFNYLKNFSLLCHFVNKLQSKELFIKSNRYYGCKERQSDEFEANLIKLESAIQFVALTAINLLIFQTKNVPNLEVFANQNQTTKLEPIIIFYFIK